MRFDVRLGVRPTRADKARVAIAKGSFIIFLALLIAPAVQPGVDWALSGIQSLVPALAKTIVDTD